MKELIHMFLKYDDIRETLGLLMISVTTLTLAPLTIYLSYLSY
jgi:hypothetical protein